MRVPEKLLTEYEVAEILGVSPKTLRKWRSLGMPGPKFRKIGRFVRYTVADLNEYLEQACRK